MATSVSWPSDWYINTNWSDSTSVFMVVNSPEVGAPITRMRSHNVKHALKVTADMTYEQVEAQLPAFMYDISYGNSPFSFVSPVDSKTYDTYLDMSSKQPYTVKRKNDSLYTVTFNVYYIKTGAF